MDNLSEDVRADFLNGSNGAVVSFFFKKNCPLILLYIHVTYSNLLKTVPLKSKLTILTQDLKTQFLHLKSGMNCSCFKT